jgi:carboxymethylenebutenolidase
MRNYFLLFLTALVSAALLSYTMKTEIQPTVTVNKELVSCHPEDIIEIAKAEAATKEFASLHPDPYLFQLKDAKGKTVTFTTPDGQHGQGYEIPAKKKTKNYLLVIHEWYGLNDFIKQEADLLSNELDNVNVLALDLYDGKVATTADSAMKYMSTANAKRLENIIRGAIGYAGDDAKIYTIGWCFGGMWSLQASILAGKQGSGCVMYYGRPETNVDKLKQLNTDVIAFFGNLDKSITPEKVTEFENNMNSAGRKLTVYRYDAGHGFANPSNPSFNKEAREDAHKKTIEYLKERIK